jgi:acetyl esterase
MVRTELSFAAPHETIAAMLDPQAKAYLDLVAAANLPEYHTLSPADARLAYKKSRRIVCPDPPEVAAVEALAAPGPGGAIPIRAYRAAGTARSERLPALIYLHGGGWTIGDPDTHDVVCRTLANGARCAVFSVDYRLAPEHKFPAAVDDALAAMRWIASEAARLDIDAARVAIGGDSAGGNLATVAALALRDAGGPPLVFQLLIYPATDFHCRFPSHRENAEGYLLTAKSIAYFAANYLNGAHEYDDWRASPLYASSLAGLPPALVLTAGCDPLRDEGKAYADRLRDAGVPVEYLNFEGQIHGFIMMGRVIDEANRAVDRCAQALRKAFG